MKTRWIAMLLCLILLTAPLSSTALAEDSNTIALGTDAIKSGEEVYIGERGSKKVLWTAIDDNGFLLCNHNIGSTKFRNCPYSRYDPTSQYPGYYAEDDYFDPSDSFLKLAMEALYNGTGTSLFTASERAAIAATTLTPLSMFEYGGDAVQPVTAYLYPLSYDEVMTVNRSLWAARDIDDSVTVNEQSTIWWTRTSDSQDNAIRVENGSTPIYTDDLRYATRGVRPAMHLKANAILFASVAQSGKSAAGMGSGLAAVPAVSVPTAWKLTVSDASRSDFSIVTQELTAAKAVVSYFHAKTGANEYLSGMIVDGSNNVLYYGRLKRLSSTADASGILTIEAPSGVTLGRNATLKVFNEQFNGDQSAASASLLANTDYASELLSTVAPASPTANIRNVPVYAGSPATLSVSVENATGYQWWSNDGSGWTPIPSATDMRYTTAPVTLQNSQDQYYCVVTSNGVARTLPIFKLNVSAAPKVPATGDGSTPMLWLGLMLLAGAGLVFTRRRRHA